MSLTGKIKGSVLKGSINRLYELQGYSAYDVAVLNGFEGTEEEWLSSLKGEKGDPGSAVYKGDPGYTPVKGVDYYTDADKEEMANEVEERIRSSLSSVTLDDYDIEHGVTGIWNWRKRASGAAEIWGTFTSELLNSLGEDRFYPLPFVMFDPSKNWPVPNVTYSAGNAFGLINQETEPNFFEIETIEDEESGSGIVVANVWRVPSFSFYDPSVSNDGALISYTNNQYTIDVHMFGRWKPVDDEPSKEILAINVGGGSADAVLYTPQTLTEEQQTQARENIGAVSEAVLDELKQPVAKELRYSTTTNVCINTNNGNLVNAGNSTRCVAKATVKPNTTYILSGSCQHGFAYWAIYDAEDTLLTKSGTANGTPYVFENIEVVAPENASYIVVAYITTSVIAKIETVSMELVLEQDAVLYTEQSLTEEQKAQARKNIGSAPANAVVDCSRIQEGLEEGGYIESNVFTSWNWKKYIDGTFEFLGTSKIGFSFDMSYEENMDESGKVLVYEQEEGTPIDFYNFEYSYAFYFPYGDTAGLETLEFNIIPVTEFGGPPGSYMFYVYATQETFDAMREAGLEGQCFFMDVSITGNWRVDE